MFKKLLFAVIFPALITTISLAQSWEPDAITSTFVSLKKDNGKYGLVRNLGDGSKDSIEAVYDFICKYDGYLMNPNYIGKKDSSWYELNFNKPPVLIPGKKYIGNGLFMTSKGSLFSIYSCSKKKNILTDLIEYDKDFSDVLNMDTSSNNVDYYRPFYYTTGDINFWVKDKSGIKYWLDYWGKFSFKNASVFKNKTGNKNQYGFKNYGENNNVLLKPIYDTIINFFSFTFTKKGQTYDIYNSLMKKIAEAQDLNYSFCFRDMLIISKQGKLGLIDYYGDEILKPIFDTIWIDKFIIAKQNDSLFFNDGDKFIFTLQNKQNVTYKIRGEYEFLPFHFYEIDGKIEKHILIYNPYKEIIYNTSSYDDLYLFGIQNGKHLLVAKKKDKYGIIDLAGNIVHPFEYDYISKGLMEDYWMVNRFYAITKNGKTGFFDSKLKEIVPMSYNGIGLFNIEYQMIPSLFTLKKDKLWYLFDWKTKSQSEFGYDTILIGENYKYYDPQISKTITPLIASKNGEIFYIDTIGRKYYNFRNIETRETENQVFLEEKKLNKIPVNITPLATINHIEDLNQEHSYAIVFCLNRYFVINKYGEMSSGFEKMIEFYEPKLDLIFGGKSKSTKSDALYTFTGTEVGKLSKYNWAIHLQDNVTYEHYFVFGNSKKKQGLMNSKGEEILKCEYFEILEIKDGKCEVKITETSKISNINLNELKN